MHETISTLYAAANSWIEAFFSYCWTHYPALLYGLTFFSGASLALFNISWLVFFCVLSIILLPLCCMSIAAQGVRCRILLALLLGIASFLLTFYTHQLPDQNMLIHKGLADITFSSITHSKNHFGSIWTYKGTLHSLIHKEAEQQNITAKNLPITFSIPANSHKTRPSADHRYILPASLKQTPQGSYSLSTAKTSQWDPFDHSWNLAEWRLQVKTDIRRTIYSAIKDLHSAAFLAGIATGEFDDRQLAFELGRFGLQHLMAISGLHFAILASILGVMLQLVFSHKTSAYLLIALLSSYFLFLGPSPSVIRAWVSITIGLIGILLSKRSSGLNSLGIALFVVTLWDPFAAQNIGFQFSFAVTAAILVWFTPFDKLCRKLFPQRQLSDIATMSLLSQHGYCLLYFFRQALALTLSVNLIALPMTLFHFQKFPLMSFIYNLFFPALISLSMLLLTAALLISLASPWLSQYLHTLNESFTQFILSFTFNFPQSFDVTIRTHEIPKDGLIIYLLVVFFIGLSLKHRIETTSQPDDLFRIL